MKVYLHYALVLLIITALACGILALVNQQTKPIIDRNLFDEENNAREQVISAAKTFEKQELKNGKVYYIAKDEKGKEIGYTFISCGRGYSSDVQIMVGIDTDFKIEKIIIIQQSETPGLGANCIKPEFSEKYTNLEYKDLTVDKDGGNIKSITGATITTRTVTNAIKKDIYDLENELVGITFKQEVKDELI
ncbi:MAG TPA: FMN-binding protein [Candidatus Cloacimonadota bacterium]|nr:FMN-binding protein [Candidatus Cloacimonadota bacterium]